jgi:hypothetical protein
MDWIMYRTVFCLALLTTSAHAATLEKVFPLGQPYCLAYSNDKAPAGQTESLELFSLFGPHDVEEEISASAKEEAAKFREQGSYIVDVQARFKGDKRAYWQSVGCSEDEGTIRCSVDCDGGSFTGKVSKDAFSMKVDQSGFVLQGGCGDEGEVNKNLTQKEAPNGLTLTKRDVKYCEDARAKNYATRLRDEVSLRKRISDNTWRCLSRTYDDTYLAAHLKQTVKKISVSIIDAPKRVVDADGYTNTKMRVEVKATLRNGKTLTSKDECNAFTTEFSCNETYRLFRRDGSSALLKMGSYDPAPGDDPTELKLAGTKLGDDDKLFRLDASTKACE